MKIVFRTYTKKDGTPEYGYYDIMEYLNGLTEKDLVVRIDYNKKTEFGLDERDFFFPSLKISKLKLTPLDDGRKFEASFESKNLRAVFALFATLAITGNCGHSFELSIGKKTFYIDGDGADYIESINGHKITGKMVDDRYHWPDYYKEPEKEVEVTEGDIREMVAECVKRLRILKS